MKTIATLFLAFTLSACNPAPEGTTPANVCAVPAVNACGPEVVQADLCPNGVSALCYAGGEAGGVSAPVLVTGCNVAHTPTEGVTAYAACVAACPGAQ